MQRQNPRKARQPFRTKRGRKKSNPAKVSSSQGRSDLFPPNSRQIPSAAIRRAPSAIIFSCRDFFPRPGLPLCDSGHLFCTYAAVRSMRGRHHFPRSSPPGVRSINMHAQHGKSIRFVCFEPKVFNKRQMASYQVHCFLYLIHRRIRSDECVDLWWEFVLTLRKGPRVRSTTYSLQLRSYRCE